MDRQKARVLEQALLKLIKESKFEETHGVKVTPKGGTIYTTSLTSKIEFADVSKDGKVQSKEAEDWKWAVMDGLPKDGLGKIFACQGRKYKVVGYKPKSSRFSVLAERQPDGKVFKFEPQAAFPDCDLPLKERDLIGDM